MKSILARARARLLQFELELWYVAQAVEALVCCLYHLGMSREADSARRPLVLVDRDSARNCIAALRALRVIAPVEVKVLSAFPAVDALLAGLESEQPARTVVLSRLLYAKYYMRFQKLRLAGALVVA